MSQMADENPHAIRIRMALGRLRSVTIEAAVELGAALNAARDDIEHGRWKAWLQIHFPELSYRSAAVYMQVAKHRPKSAEAALLTSITRTLDAISEEHGTKGTHIRRHKIEVKDARTGRSVDAELHERVAENIYSGDDSDRLSQSSDAALDDSLDERESHVMPDPNEGALRLAFDDASHHHNKLISLMTAFLTGFVTVDIGAALSMNDGDIAALLKSVEATLAELRAGMHADSIGGDFGLFWQHFPKREGSNPKNVARKVYESIIAKGEATVAELLAGAKREADRARALDGPEFIPMVSTWLNQKRWQDNETPSATGSVPKKSSVQQLHERMTRRLHEQGSADRGSSVPADRLLSNGQAGRR